VSTPEIAGVSAEVGASWQEDLQIDTTSSQTTTRTDTYEIDQNIKVPPFTKVRADIQVLETAIQSEWATDVVITGCYFYKWSSGKFDYFPVADLLWYRSGFTCRTTDDSRYCSGKECTFKASGSYSGAAGVDSKIKTTSSPCTE
jgi:hypothetical protein